MSTTPAIKAPVGEVTVGSTLTTSSMSASFAVTKIDHYDGLLVPDAHVEMESHWMDAQDCLEAARFFKQLAKTLSKT